MMAWLDRLAWPWLLVAALLLGAAPVLPEPHLVEKLRMLAQGTLKRPLDIFDLLMHAAPLVLVLLKAWRQWRRSQQGVIGGR